MPEKDVDVVPEKDVDNCRNNNINIITPGLCQHSNPVNPNNTFVVGAIDTSGFPHLNFLLVIVDCCKNCCKYYSEVLDSTG